MTTHREVMQQALETLNFLKRGMDSGHIKCRTYIVHDPDATQAEIKHPVELVNNDIAAISAALTEPQDAELAGLKDRIQSIYGQLNDTEKEVDDCRLLLRQALECLERSDTLGWQANLPVIQAIKERLDGVR
jgi:DNA-binding transcriptional regulator GbsR (MarR family)